MMGSGYSINPHAANHRGNSLDWKKMKEYISAPSHHAVKTISLPTQSLAVRNAVPRD
jgi:hypothetical protein